MDQTEFQRALQKHNNRKKKQAEAAKVVGETVNTALPWAPLVDKPKKVKPVEPQRPRPKTIAVHVSGPVEFRFEIDWSGTLLGGQMHEQALRAMFAKYLAPMGRIK